jgi:chromosome segregation ATPase
VKANETISSARRDLVSAKAETRRAIASETSARTEADAYRNDAIAFKVMMGGKGELRDAEELLARRTKMLRARDVSKDEKDDAIRSLRSELKSAVGEMAKLRTDLSDSADAAAELEILLFTSQARVAKLDKKALEHASAASRSNGKLGGRPIVARTDEDLEDLKPRAASSWSKAATDRLLDVIGEVGTDTPRHRSR